MTRRDAGPSVYLVSAIGCSAAGALLLWAAATGAPALRVPPVIALILAGMLAVAAWRLLQLHRSSTSTGDGAAALMLTAMAVFCLWVGIGPGSRLCGVGSGGRPLAEVSGLACRVPFGLGGMLVTLAALHAARRWMRGRRTTT